MAIRRTREQKQRIEARREEGLNFSWKPTEQTVQPSGKRAQVSLKTGADFAYLRQDLLRTAIAVGLASGVLFLAWWL